MRDQLLRPTLNTMPPCLQFAPGCRLHPTRDVVLIPEGTLDLRGPARDILLLVDGTRPADAIIAELAAAYDAPAETIRADVLPLLAALQQRGILREAPCPS